jgi:ferredoxin
VINISKIYEELRLHLDKLPVGFPATDSKIEIDILRELFNRDEAFIATKLSFFPLNLKQIKRKLKKEGRSFENLELILEEMYEKGTIAMRKNGGEKLYSNAMFVVGLYEYQLGRLTPNLVFNIFRYFKEGYFEKEYNLTGIPQLRTIPVNESITPDLSVASYDQLRSFIENSTTIGIMDCICRKAHDLIDDPCKRTDLRETCMTFGSAARMFHEKGQARLISKREAYNLALEFEKEGLVPSPSNSQKPFVVCNCCGCCCEVISNQKRFENPSRFFATNFYAEIDKNECIGCGSCQERCNMDAIQLIDDYYEIDRGKCIGCGLCIDSCPNESITFKKKKEETIPPKNTLETYMKIIEKKNQLKTNSK